MVNYNEEVNRLESFKPTEGSLFWKPTAGQYKVKALGELVDADPFVEEGKADKPQVKVELEIKEYKGKATDVKLDSKTWTMSVGKSTASSYGQLCQLAKAKDGKLTGIEFTIVVVNDGTKNSYTIVM